MDMLTDFNQLIIPNYSPISARGGKKCHRKGGRSRKLRTRRHKKSNTHSKNARTRRRYS
jgi:hypothetical protein